jgi:hypothetical protein
MFIQHFLTQNDSCKTLKYGTFYAGHPVQFILDQTKHTTPLPSVHISSIIIIIIIIIINSSFLVLLLINALWWSVHQRCKWFHKNNANQIIVNQIHETPVRFTDLKHSKIV